MNASPAIEVVGVTKVFPVPFRRRRVVAVRGLDLRVEPGEVYGLLGPNGSGKSTTLKVILGLVKATEGRAAIFGMPSTSVQSREQVGFLPENPYFQKYLSGVETLRFYGRLCGVRGTELEDRVRELLALVGLEEAGDRRLGGYSKGMLQRIGLAQALVQRPRLVVLDEPTAGVDPAGSRDIRDLILRLKADGLTVLLCSHLLEQVQQVCDRVGILSRGVMVREGRLDELVAVQDQVELVLEGSTPESLENIEEAIRASGARLVSSGRPRQSLESLYLEVTSSASGTAAKPGEPQASGEGDES